MDKKTAHDVCKKIQSISPYVRFVAVIDKKGKVVSYLRREGLYPMLDTKNTTHQFSHIAIKSGMEAQFDKQLGHIQFVWEEREKAQIISFAIGQSRAWMSIDKKVVRSEILRIIDNCLPIVKAYTTPKKKKTQQKQEQQS